MPAPLRWLVILLLIFGVPYVLADQLVWLITQDNQLKVQAGLLVAGAFTALSLLAALQLPSLYVRYHEAKKLAGNQYQNHLRAYAQSAEKLKIRPPELLIINEGAPIGMAVGLLPGQRKILITRGLYDGLDPDQFVAYLDYLLVMSAKGHTAPMTLGCGAAFIMLLPLRLADIADNDALRVLLTIIFGWFGAIFIQAAGLRSQAYELDQIAGKHHGVGGLLALGSALNACDKVLFKHPLGRIDYSSSPLWVTNPLGGKGVAAIFATHAPTPKRVKRLQRQGTRVVGKEAVARSKGMV